MSIINTSFIVCRALHVIRCLYWYDIILLYICPVCKFFNVLSQDVPFSARHPSLGRPVYVRLLDVLLSKCEFPEGFVSWEDQNADVVDEDSLMELREGAQVTNKIISSTSCCCFFISDVL